MRAHILTVLLLFVLALVPRVFAVGVLWTADEAKKWSARSEAFLLAVQEGDFASTNQTGHPGVTTMWVGAAGIVLHQRLVDQGWVAPDDHAAYRAALRFPLAATTALCLALAYPLARRLFGASVALLAALFWSGDAFLLAHSLILHVDALMTFFILLALLALLVAFRLDEGGWRGREGAAHHESQTPMVRWGMLAASGVAGGLALLTKSPALILLPLVVLIALVGAARKADTPRAIFRLPLRRLVVVPLLLAPLVWGTIAALTWVALWPAAWVAPLDAASSVVNEVLKNGSESHGWGNFFMGRALPDPGLLFYPVAIVLRLTPWTMVGLFVAALLALRSLVATVATRRLPPPRTSSPALAVVLLFVLLLVVAMSLLPKKFDRYMLPAFPALDLVAAIGIMGVIDGVQHWWKNHQIPLAIKQVTGIVSPTAWLLMGAGVVLNLFTLHPYYLAAYNPLLGGGSAASHAILVGWGEGLEQAGSYISQQAEGCTHDVISWYPWVLFPYLCSYSSGLDNLTMASQANYVVLYINQFQRKLEPEALAVLRHRGALVHTVRIHGIDYAHVYQLRLPDLHTLNADFGSSLRLVGYKLDTSDLHTSSTSTLTLQWQAREAMRTDYTLFLHVFDSSGTLVGQVDVPPGGPGRPTSTWQRNQYVAWSLTIPLEASSTARPAWITLGLYDPRDLTRLPLRAAPALAPGAPDDGPGALVLPLNLSPHATAVPLLQTYENRE
jgi:hypothetical protein